MAATPEAKVKERVRTVLKLHKVYHFSPAANGYGRAGIPDFICCVNGFFLAIECKAGANEPTALQKLELDAIMQAGGAALVVNETNIEDVTKIVEGLNAALDYNAGYKTAYAAGFDNGHSEGFTEGGDWGFRAHMKQPLTEAEIFTAIRGVDSLKAVEVARAIERAHRIGMPAAPVVSDYETDNGRF